MKLQDSSSTNSHQISALRVAAVCVASLALGLGATATSLAAGSHDSAGARGGSAHTASSDSSHGNGRHNGHGDQASKTGAEGSQSSSSGAQGQPSTQPASQPVSQPATQPVAQTAVEPASQPVSQPASQSSSPTAAGPSSQPSSPTAAEPASQPASQPSTQTAAAASSDAKAQSAPAASSSKPQDAPAAGKDNAAPQTSTVQVAPAGHQAPSLAPRTIAASMLDRAAATSLVAEGSPSDAEPVYAQQVMGVSTPAETTTGGSITVAAHADLAGMTVSAGDLLTNNALRLFLLVAWGVVNAVLIAIIRRRRIGSRQFKPINLGTWRYAQ